MIKFIENRFSERVNYTLVKKCLITLFLFLSLFTSGSAFAMYDSDVIPTDFDIPKYEPGKLIVGFKESQSPAEIDELVANLYLYSDSKIDKLFAEMGGNVDSDSGKYFFEGKLYNDVSKDKVDILTEIFAMKKARIQSKVKTLSLAEEKVGNLDSLGLYYYVYSFSEDQSLNTKINEIKKLPEVDYAEPKYIYEIQKTPNDPSYSKLWGLTKTQAELAWDKSIGNKDILIAVSDGELAKTHPDLVDNISEVKMLYPCSNGSIWHGTHVSGTIGAVGDNNIGVAGVNWKAKILFINIGCGRNIDVEGGADSIDYAVSQGARVMNMSWGGSYSSLVANSIKKAKEKGLIMVVAAGNSERETPGCADKMYPAKDPNVITVAASTQNDTRASFSCTGNAVDITAPGFGIYSTVGNGEYGSMNGTSMAAPHVTGLVGLLLSFKPELDFNNVKKIIQDSADKIDDGDQKKYGAGRINIGNAMAQIAGDTNPSGPVSTIVPTGSNSSIKSSTPIEQCGNSGWYKKLDFECLDGRKGSIVPENNDECGVVEEMRSEAEKACKTDRNQISPLPTGTISLPQTGTISPLPTGEITPSGANEIDNNISFKVRLQGVTGTPRLTEVKVKIGMKDPSLDEAIYQESTIKYLGNSIWEGFGNFNLKPKANYVFLIKGPFHMQRKFCENNPKELFKGIYQCLEGKLALGIDKVSWDFSTIPLLVGDLPDPDGVQDGIVNARDIAQLRQSIDRADPEILDFCDVNYDGACNTTDYSLLIAALSSRADEN